MQKVSGKEIAYPVKEGGLGAMDIHTWNKALIMKHIWFICLKKDSLWIKWVHNVIFTGKNFWSVTIPNDCSWIWRKILQLRPRTWLLFKMKVGNGEKTSL